jgi:ornithine racemase
MSAPLLDIDLDRIGYNAKTLVERLSPLGVTVTGVTKATLGSAPIARALLAAGVKALGDSRIENIEALRRCGVSAPVTLIRTPMLSQVDRVVAHADVSLNTELEVLRGLSSAARVQHRVHGVVLMVELGDLREGVLPTDVAPLARQVLGLPHLRLVGIGTNLGCQSGVSPDSVNMGELSALVDGLEATLDMRLGLVSGGNSANLRWALGGHGVGRVNDLRLGEAILLGREPLQRESLDGLHTDAFTLFAEVVESKAKPSVPWGDIGQTAFGPSVGAVERSYAARVIVALGRQDVDPGGLVPPTGMQILGSSSDHLVLGVAEGPVPEVGSEVALGVTGYGALLSAMTSPFVARVYRGGDERVR